MGYTNLQESLVFAYRRWLGEKQLLERQIDEIEKAHLTLEEKRGRVEQCARLIASVDVIMSEISDVWDPPAVTPAQRHASSLPFENGEVTRWTLDILRRSPVPMRSIHIARQLVTEREMDVADKAFVAQVNKAVDGTLRSMARRNHVEKTDDEPIRWRIVGRAGPART
ncbi:hypothetical protein [Sphingomonas bacterium]|uniref:hypothetical protein n=1 Tax=Sphingomonas bacterium TaxID=1895847 RepID=UPI001575C86B|nr:hypothetical protein [Sphingomonas bacterium]